jgi:hypothetical protein
VVLRAAVTQQNQIGGVDESGVHSCIKGFYFWIVNLGDFRDIIEIRI